MNQPQTAPLRQTARELANTTNQVVDQLADATTDVADAAKTELDELRSSVPQALKATVQRTLSDAEAAARRGMDHLRDASDTVRTQVTRAGDRTVNYIQDEPVKSVLIAAAVGAASAALIGWMARNRPTR